MARNNGFESSVISYGNQTRLFEWNESIQFESSVISYGNQTDKYGENTEDWQHVKAKCVIKIDDEEIPAEIYWSQCEEIGKFDLFVKGWLDEG